MRRALTIGVALVAGLAPLPRPFIERAYSNGFYSVVQPQVTRVSNHVGFALLDALILVAIAALVAGVVIAIRSRRRDLGRAILRLALSIAAACALLYLAFLVLWGWNYRRVPLVEKLSYEPSQVSPAAVTAAAQSAAASLNGLYAPSHAAGWAADGQIDPALARAFAETVRLLGAARPTTPGRPKSTVLEPYFRRAGVSGMTDPYFLETLVDTTLLPFERPFVVAHEWAHLAGYANEGEANFIGWLTCMHAGAPEQYSGWLFLYDELVRSAPAPDRAAIGAALHDGVRADRRAIANRLRANINPTVALAGWRAYDRYLKANRVVEGTASYDTVVRLALGVKFGPGWAPLRR